MSDSVRPHRRQPTRLPCPWDSPGKNTGVGCHFLLQCRKVKIESEVVQSCLTFSNPMDCTRPGSSIHGIFQTRVLEWGAITFSGKLVIGGYNYIRHYALHSFEISFHLPSWNQWNMSSWTLWLWEHSIAFSIQKWQYFSVQMNTYFNFRNWKWRYYFG